MSVSFNGIRVRNEARQGILKVDGGTMVITIGNNIPYLSSCGGLFGIRKGTVATSSAKSTSKSSPDFSIPKLT